MPMKLDSRQTRQRSKLDQLSTTTDLRLDAIMNLINDELTMPLRMRANLGAGVDGSPNQNLYIDSINVKTYDTGVADSGHERSRTIPPVGSSMPSYTGGGYITFPTTSGGSITGTGLTLDKSYTLTLTSGQYVKIMVWINGSSQFGMEIGTPAASEALAQLPAPPTDAYVLGYIVMNNTGGTISKALNENIYQFVGGGGAGGGSGASREITQSNSFSVGDVVYFDGTNYVKAQANAANTAEAIGVVSKASATKFTLTELGYVTGLSGLTAGEVYYLSAATAGALTSTEPSTIGHVSKPMLIADSTTSGYVLNYRGSIVGGANARTEISLSNNASTNTQLVTAYDAGEMTGWVVITGTTSYRFYVAIQFSKNAAGSDYNVSYQTSGETLPAGFSIQYSANYITVTLPNVAGFSSAKLNYALNAPAVGATFPLTVDSTSVSFNTIQAKDSSGLVFKEDGGAQVGAVIDNGSWTMGISQASNPGKHVFYGTQGTIANQNYVLELRANDTSTSDVVIRYGLDRVNGQGFQDVAVAGVGGAGYRFAANTTDVGGHTSGGAWTLGQTSFTSNSFHKIQGTCGLAMSFGSGATGIGANCFYDSIRNYNRTGTTTNGAAVIFDANVSGSSTAITIVANQAGDGVSTAADVIATATGAGAWTLGPSSGSEIHLIRGGANSGAGIGAPLNLLNTTGGVAWRVGPTNNNGFVVFNSSDVGLYITNGATSWTGTSDIRMKKNVVDSEFGLQEVMSLRPVKFDYTMDSSEESARVGFIAQEVHAVLPHAAYKPENEEEMMGVSPTEMIPVLVKAIQELKTQLDQAQSEIEAIKNK